MCLWDVMISTVKSVYTAILCYLITGIAKAQVPYGWMTFSVLHLTLCCQHAQVEGLGMKIVSTLRMWQ